MPISAIKREKSSGKNVGKKREEMEVGEEKEGKLVENAPNVRAILAEAESQ